VQIFVWQTPGQSAHLVTRTLRSLRQRGLEGVVISEPLVDAFLPQAGLESPVVLLKAGTWFLGTGLVPVPPSSATGLGVCAVGIVPEHGVNSDWPAWLNGAVQTSAWSTAELPEAVFLDSRMVKELASGGGSKRPLLELILERRERIRLVAWPDLRIAFDPRLRVIQAVTSIQRGGAERIALSLTTELARRGVNVRLAAPFRPTRDAFPKPKEWLDLEKLSAGRRSTFDTLLEVAGGFDLLHLHLFKSDEVRRLVATGIPCVVSVHNSRAGWPVGLETSRGDGVALLAACSLEVEAELRSVGMEVPIRTVWNGVDVDLMDPEKVGGAVRRNWRERWGFGESDLVLLAIANPRPQKRLHLLPAVLSEVRLKLRGTREARLVFAGQASGNLPEAQASLEAVQSEVARLGLQDHVHWAGALDDVAALLTAGDVVVSASAHEGLSLTHLEALVMNRPVVCTATAGAREVAADNPAVTVLPLEFSAENFAKAVIAASETDHSGARERVCRHFTAERMTERYLASYRRVLSGTKSPGEGLWLVTNNFSMGGAQTSARRLFRQMAGDGVRVRAAVLQEPPEHPTAGTRALRKSGVEVRVFGPHGSVPEEQLVDDLLAALDADPPAAVVFWNVIPIYKMLLADALWTIRIIDVSPGEMFFQSLERFFTSPHPGMPYLTATDYGRRLGCVVVKYTAEVGLAAQLGAPVEVIPNGVPMPKPRSPGRRSGDRLIFGTASRINPQKRLEDVIAALQLAKARLPDFEFRVAGRVEPGCQDYFSKLQSLADGLPIRWLGELPDTDEFLDGLDLFLMSSEPAGCPNASLEALAAGLPVVATDVGGASEQVLDGVTGRLVPARDVAAFAEALVELVAAPESWPRFGEAARKHVAERFSMGQMALAYRRVCFGG